MELPGVDSSRLETTLCSLRSSVPRKMVDNMIVCKDEVLCKAVILRSESKPVQAKVE